MVSYFCSNIIMILMAILNRKSKNLSIYKELVDLIFFVYAF